MFDIIAFDFSFHDFELLFRSLIFPLIFLELIDRIADAKTHWLRKITVFFSTFFIIELTGRLEIKYLDLFNEYFSHTVIGVYEYTFYFMLTISLIEETLKVFAMIIFLNIGVTIKGKFPKLKYTKDGYKSPYNTLGVGCMFAGIETFVYVQRFTKIDPVKEIIRDRLLEGAMATHIGIAFSIYMILILYHEHLHINKIVESFSLFLGYIFGIAIHTAYNYHSILIRSLYTLPKWMIDDNERYISLSEDKFLPVYFGLSLIITIFIFKIWNYDSWLKLYFPKSFFYILRFLCIIISLLFWINCYFILHANDFPNQLTRSIPFSVFLLNLFAFSHYVIFQLNRFSQIGSNPPNEIIPNL